MQSDALVSGQKSFNLSGEQQLFVKEIEDLEADFVRLVERMGKSREISLAITQIQLAAFWAKKHIIPSL